MADAVSPSEGAVIFAEALASARGLLGEDRDAFIRGTAWIWDQGRDAGRADAERELQAFLAEPGTLAFASVALIIYRQVGDWNFVRDVIHSMGEAEQSLRADFEQIASNVELMMSAGWEAQAIGLALAPADCGGCGNS